MSLRPKVVSVRDVAERQLCCGCGTCAYIDPGHIHMVDDARSGRRPIVNAGAPDATHDPAALAVCPGVHLEHAFDRHDPELIRELTDAWGPVREVWEGHAADPEIRFAGSSGGAASALALFCIERLGFHGVLHIAARPDVPYLNHTVLSTTRAEILARTGSRYAPASPCDGLQMIEDAPGPCVFIGKPCDVAAVQRARRMRPELDSKIGLTIAIFCAGTPTTRATLALLRHMGVDDPSRVLSLRYRGHGWPGRCVVTFRAPIRIPHAGAGPGGPPLAWRALSATAPRGPTDRPSANGELSDSAGTFTERSLSYEESWGLLARNKQWRCHICPDHTGEFADIAVGDPWHRSPSPGEPGRSLVLARTPRGQRLLAAAREAGVLRLEVAPPEVLWAARPGQKKDRGALWGRRVALRILGLPAPRQIGFPTFRFWLCELSIGAKLRSLLGTLRRAFRKRLHFRAAVTPYEPPTTLTCRHAPLPVDVEAQAAECTSG